MAKRKVMRCRLAVLMAERVPPLTQKRLAKETRLSPTTISQLYQNKFKRVDVDTVDTLCDYFNCDIGDLFVRREVEQEE